MKRFVFLILISVGAVACSSQWKSLYDADEPREVNRIAEKPSVGQGDAARGLDYLTTGDYVGSGFPWSFARKDSVRIDTVFMREGKNALISWQNIAFTAPNGETVVSGSCFSCHASAQMGQVTLGLGDSYSDFTSLKPWQAPLFKRIVKKNASEAEWETAENYVNWLAHSFAWIRTDQIGLNSAFRLEEAFAAHRDPVTLAYSKQEVFPNQGPNVACDVPPLWNVKKKNALYYNGMGRGDFTKLLMQAGMMGIADTVAAREIQQRFVDVVAWLEALEPPAYPGKIDVALSQKGELVFEENCQKCHGSYGAFPEYPNKIIPLWKIQTDPVYAQYFMEESGLPAWFNKSWFGQTAPVAQLLPSNGYIAPPLDGVWATAPYLHNGSVPNIATLLNSKLRPAIWTRSGSTDNYDLEQIGYPYQEGKERTSPYTYDTSKPGQSNSGHYFGDELTDEDRIAVLEYLKTL
ncbi:MAG: hypothetical protein NWR72_00760 [Bacteroidia bacterium]|nr:hypothetical protein [Bacteroidia bacterium]